MDLGKHLNVMPSKQEAVVSSSFHILVLKFMLLKLWVRKMSLENQQQSKVTNGGNKGGGGAAYAKFISLTPAAVLFLIK